MQWSNYMPQPPTPKHELMKSFLKDNAETRIRALRWVMAPSIIWATTGLLGTLTGVGLLLARYHW